MNELTKKYNNIFVKTENKSNNNLNRINKIIQARNSLSKFYKEFLIKNEVGSEWIFLFDTDIIFNYEESILPLLEKIKFSNRVLMILTYSVFSGFNDKLNRLINKQNMNISEKNYLRCMLNFYYDSLALEYGKYYNKNSLDFLQGEMIKIKTGFGGLGMIKTNYYLSSYYDNVFSKQTDRNLKLGNLYCEHWGFGERLNQNGEMYICKSSNSLWYQDRDFDIEQNKFKNYVIFFIKNKELNNIL